MVNVLKDNLDILEDVSRMISAETGCNIIICDHDGEIIEATQRERIGRSHVGAKIIMSGLTDEAVISPAQEQAFRKLGTDTRVGYNYVIMIQGQRVGSLGIAGDPDSLKPIVRIAAKTIGLQISQYLKEKEKNKIIQKMTRIGEEISEQSVLGLDYNTFTEDILNISGAKYVLFNMYNTSKDMSQTVAVSGDIQDLLAAGSEILGYPLLGKQWQVDRKILFELKESRLVVFPSLTDFPDCIMPRQKAEELNTAFGLGQVCMAEISHRGNIIGNFIMILDKDTTLRNEVLIELYASQTGHLLKKVEAEDALKKSVYELQQTLNILDSFWQHSPNPISILDKKGTIIRISKSGAELFGTSPEVLEGISITEVFPPELADKLMDRIQALSYQSGPQYYTDSIELFNNDLRHYDSWVFPVAHVKEDKDLVGIVSLDITDRKNTEERLNYLSLHDPVTGLYNRTYYERELARLEQGDCYPVSVISLDADGLKIINDTMGHNMGDELLKNMAQILKKSLRESDILARVGGDEFIVFLPKTDKTTAEEIAEKIREEIKQYNEENLMLPLSVSLGLETAETPQVSLEDVLKRADESMYNNKFLYKKSSQSQILNSFITSLEKRDYVSPGYAERLFKLFAKLSQSNRLPSGTLRALALLAQVHDLGNIAIPDSILTKPEPLNDEEWKVVRLHPEKGSRIASISPELANITELILKHHERWDGKGYPLGLKGKEIPIECRILAVVDSFNAMITERPYRKALTKLEAVKELKKCSGTQFDPEIVDLFINILIEEGLDAKGNQIELFAK